MARIKGITQKEYDLWEVFCKKVQDKTTKRLYEKKHEREERIAYLLKPENYGEFFFHYFREYCDDGRSRCSKYQVRNNLALHRNPIITLLQIHHRQSAKSTHANMGYPMNLMFNDEVWFMIVMGYNEKKAARLLKDMQAQLQFNQRIINDFGTQFSHGDWADGSFVTTKGVAFESLSYIQDPAGMRELSKRPDYCSVDDVDNRKKARNQVLVKEAVENITSNLSEAMSFERQRMVISNNRKVKDGVIDKIIEELGFDNPQETNNINGSTLINHKKRTSKISWVNAVDNKGRPTWPERYDVEYWKQKKSDKTHRTWEREYMNNPIEDGHIFKAEWIRYRKPLPYERYDHLVLYGDLSYTDTGDLKSMHLLGKTGREFDVLKAFNRQTSNTNAAKWLYDLYEDQLRDAAVIYMIEANFIQGMYLNDFEEEGDRRGYQINVFGDKRSKGNKYDRIENIVPVFERGYLWLNELEKKNPDMIKLVDCLLAFEKGSGAPDDPPDSLEGALYELNKRSANPISKMRVVQRKNTFID